SALALPALSLSPGATYRFTLTVTDPVGPVSSAASVAVAVNPQPILGNCSVSPMSGSAFVTAFTVTCAGFAVGDPAAAPLLYAVYFAASIPSASYLQLTPISAFPSLSFA